MWCVCVEVLRLLEDVGLPELVIQLASLAIAEATNDINSQVIYGNIVTLRFPPPLVITLGTALKRSDGPKKNVYC